MLAFSPSLSNRQNRFGATVLMVSEERMLPPAALAGVHVAAEHGGAARLDGAHDLEPGGVDAPFVALTESGAGAAEDLRHARAFGLHAPSVAQRCEA